MLHKNITKLYLSRFFHNLIFAYAIERLFWASRGMSPMMVIYTEIIYAFVIMLLEIPTGILADRVSRRKILIAADLLSLLEGVIIVFSYSFTGFAVAVALAGVSTSLRSGTERALLYESLKFTGNQKLFEKCVGRLNVYDYTAAIIAALLGGVLASRFDLAVNYYISIISTVLALGFSVSLVDVKNGYEVGRPPKHILRDSLKQFRLQPVLILFALAFCFISVTEVHTDEFWQLYLDAVEIPVIFFGVYSVLSTIARAPGSLLAHRLLKKFSHRTILKAIMFVMGVSLILSFVFKSYGGAIAVLGVWIGSGFAEPVVTGYLHHRVPSEIRATMDSFLSLSERIFSTPIGLVFGYLVTTISIFHGYLFLGIFITLGILPLFLKLKDCP